MWAYLSTWIVQDGELPELGDQSRLVDHGVRASGRVIQPTAPKDGLELVEGPDPGGDGTMTYRLTGTVEWARPETWEWIIRVGEVSFLARLSNMHPKPGTVGERVSVLCSLAIVPGYEWLAFGFPSVRRDWIVDGLRIEHSTISSDDDAFDSRRVIAVDDLTEMHQWDDERPGLSSAYLLDLHPAD